MASTPGAGVTPIAYTDGTDYKRVVCGTKDLSATSPSAAGDTTVDWTDLNRYESVTFYCEFQGATGGSLDFIWYFSPNSGTTWVEFARHSQMAAAAAATKKIFSISKRQGSSGFNTIAKSTDTVAIAANTVIPVDFGDRIRLIYRANAGTSLGAAQICYGIASP